MDPDNLVRLALVKALQGGLAFETFNEIVAEIPVDSRFSVPAGQGRSAWQIVEHMGRTLDDLVEFTDNANGAYHEKNWPEDYWPNQANPEDPSEWEHSLERYRAASTRMESLVLDPGHDLSAPFPWGEGQTLLHEVLLAISHTAYHLGELVELTALSH